MTFHKVNLQVVLAASLLWGLGGPAVAQDPGVSTSIERVSVAEPGEMLELAPQWLGEMKTNVEGMASLDQAAKKKTDGEGVPCVTNNLAAGRSLAQVSKLAVEAMQQAIEAGDLRRARFEYRKIAIGVKNSRGLLAESERCAFGQGIQDGKTKVNLVGGATGDQDDTRAVEEEIIDMASAFDPPNSSPF